MAENSIGLEQLEAIQHYADSFSQSKGDYLISRLNITKDYDIESLVKTVCIDGLTFVLVTRGCLNVQINTEEYQLVERSLSVTGPNSQHKLLGVANDTGCEFYFLSISSKFIRSINIDLNALQNAHLRHTSLPVFTLPEKYDVLIKNYLEMLYQNANINEEQNLYTRNVSRSLIAALMYQLMQVFDSIITEDATKEDEGKKIGLRRFTYVRQFIELVHKHYTSERSVGFYADKLCISPKYLSFIIKEVTNRTAAEWIDEYVILEAKNMLRFSGMNIQQVAYALNFNNQSSFGKYFKHLTGMSPTQFQKS